MSGIRRTSGSNGEVELSEAQLDQVVGGAAIGAASGKIASTPAPGGTTRNAITDGASNTIMIAENRGGH